MYWTVSLPQKVVLIESKIFQERLYNLGLRFFCFLAPYLANLATITAYFKIILMLSCSSAILVSAFYWNILCNILNFVHVHYLFGIHFLCSITCIFIFYGSAFTAYSSNTCHFLCRYKDFRMACKIFLCCAACGYFTHERILNNYKIFDHLHQ